MSRRRKVYIGPDKKSVLLISFLFGLALLFLLGFILFSSFEVEDENVTVTGNKHYTDEQIRDIVMDGVLGHNTLYLYFKYKNRSLSGIPFVETMDVNILSANALNVTVYEKAIAGYVEYLDHYMYFDKDGIVVESSSVRQRDIPCISGLDFDNVVLYERLPIEDEDIFKSILSITQLLSKYEVETDKIYFNADKEVTLYFENAKVEMGSLENIDEKMIKLQGIIPELSGLSGTLYMDSYTEGTDNSYITFQRDDVKKHIEIYDDSVSEDSLSENALTE